MFASIYLVGLVLVVLGSIPGHVSPIVFFPAIYIITVGTGGIKPNVSTMGADQFDERYSRDRKEKESFFNWFYWSINLGALISYTAVAYICQYGAGPELGGQEWGFFIGYMIPALMMGASVATVIAAVAIATVLLPQCYCCCCCRYCCFCCCCCRCCYSAIAVVIVTNVIAIVLLLLLLLLLLLS